MPLQIFDGHNDTLSRFFLGSADEEEFFHGGGGHLDAPRARAGGFAGGMFAIFAPHPDMMENNHLIVDHRLPPEIYSQPVSSDNARRIAEAGIRCFKKMEQAGNGEFKTVTTVAELKQCLEKKIIAAVIHFEGAEPVSADLSNLESFYQAGLRSVGLVWSRDNLFGSGVPFEFPGTPNSGRGLTEAGKELVRACNRLGIIVDLSHLNGPGFYDVAKISSAPLVATHSCIHALCPSPRNLTDDQLDAIAASDGIVGINFCVSFLREDGKRITDTPLEVMAAHFRYAADRIGVRHLAVGSDFDGTTIPDSIGDAAGLPALMEALRKAGFSESELRMIASENWLRVFTASWKEQKEISSARD
jgi:membrane dipeptidase